jgi:hypothetical protein
MYNDEGKYFLTLMIDKCTAERSIDATNAIAEVLLDKGFNNAECTAALGFLLFKCYSDALIVCKTDSFLGKDKADFSG